MFSITIPKDVPTGELFSCMIPEGALMPGDRLPEGWTLDDDGRILWHVVEDGEQGTSVLIGRFDHAQFLRAIAAGFEESDPTKGKGIARSVRFCADLIERQAALIEDYKRLFALLDIKEGKQ